MAMSIKIKRRHPALIVLKALLRGIPVPVDGEEWVLEGAVFGPKRVMRNSQSKLERDVVLGVDMNLGAFVKWCEKLPEETVIQLVFGLGMAEIGKKERKERPV